MEGLNTCELPPGFRFHPTDEELVTHYLSPKVLDCNFSTKAVGEVDLYKLEPWDLPWRAKMGEKEWYFFCVRDKKYPTGSRTNRATNAGYWKATGKDKEIFRAKILVGMKKTLVFYSGRAPIGEKTNWVMHEYRLHGKNSNILPTTTKKEWVVCRVFKRTSGGNKAHISGLEGRNVHLPPLVDSSYEENATNCGEGPHVTCFSNLNPQHKSADIYSSSSSDTEFVYPSSVFSSQLGQCTGDFHWPDYVLKQEHRRVCHSYMKHNATAEFSQDDASTISMYEAALTPYNDDQDLPIISTGQMIDLDCLWNY